MAKIVFEPLDDGGYAVLQPEKKEDQSVDVRKPNKKRKGRRKFNGRGKKH